MARLEAPDDFLSVVEDNNFDTLPTATHALVTGGLPPRYGDPYDRTLIAQAQTDALTLVSVDRHCAAYDGDLLPLS